MKSTEQINFTQADEIYRNLYLYFFYFFPILSQNATVLLFVMRSDYYVFTCNFENGLCGFDPSPQSFDHAWEHVQSRLFSDIPDHTLGTGLGKSNSVYLCSLLIL